MAVAAVGVGRSNHCGALGIYVWPMIDAGLSWNCI